MAMAQFGATPNGGVCRLALSDADKAARDQFVRWCEAAGCAITIDQMGNIFARRAGKRVDSPPVMACSHLDSVPTGGKFDGTLGVLAALEVVETLNDSQVATDAPIVIASWTNEEGVRFAPAMIASGVFAGIFDLEFALGRVDKDGRNIRQELQRIGYAGTAECQRWPLGAVFELHIEQGPVLEAAGKQVGIVTGVPAIRWMRLVLEGQEAHAGSTPMHLRRDPVRAAVAILQNAYDYIKRFLPDARFTVGNLLAEPGVVNTIPGKLAITLDVRHPSDKVVTEIEQWWHRVARDNGAILEKLWVSPSVQFSPEGITAVEKAANVVGASAMHLGSGAGHDAVHLTRVAPTGMIFIPCKGGLSHNEAESITPQDAATGANVLLHAILQVAQLV
jgi:N-carbamoyl-L-amino-acid hydrolase